MDIPISPSTSTYTEIGRGSCGAIFEKPGTFEIVKRDLKEFRDDEDRSYDIWNDCQRHVAVYHAFRQAGFTDVHVPKMFNYTPKSNLKWWDEHGKNFPEPYNRPANVLTAERILPLPLSIRETLIERYSSQDKYKRAALESPKNRYGVIWPTLGRHRREKRQTSYVTMINLRNHKLSASQLEEMGVDTLKLASNMAKSLAIMHFIAHVDANDIEFLLAAAPTVIHQDVPLISQVQSEPQEQDLIEQPLEIKLLGETVHMWLIDFNMCRPLDPDDETDFAEKAKNGFIFNVKAFWPRPRFLGDKNEKDDQLWEEFRRAYLDYAQDYCWNGLRPGEHFLEAVEEHYETQAYNLQSRLGEEPRGADG